MNSVCVFCGSRVGKSIKYSQVAQNLGLLLTEYNIKLIYGGGKVGLMGILADEVIKNKGQVTGIIPDFLYRKEVGHEGLNKLLIVDSMHERKQKMSALADGFIALPGGFGTLEELAEIITWNQLNLVNKPVGILNVGNFYNSLLNYFDWMVEEGFVNANFRRQIISSDDPEELIKKMKDFKTSIKRQDLSKT